jgi:hypothetical protein
MSEAHSANFIHVVERFGYLVAGTVVLVLAVVNAVAGHTQLSIALGVCALGLLAAALPAVQASPLARVVMIVVQLAGAITAAYLLLG